MPGFPSRHYEGFELRQVNLPLLLDDFCMDDPAEGSITVFVQLPSLVEDEDDPGGWTVCLTIPTAHVFRFSLKPYKWIRFITGIVLGAEGILCDSGDADAPEIDYDRHPLPGNSSVYYCVLDPAERARIFPLDPNLAHPYTATGSMTSTRCANFRTNIIARDSRCVVSGAFPPRCQAAHLIGHSKGDEYIKAFTNARSRDLNESDVILDIDDTRNGILVNSYFHQAMSQRDTAFLVTPNFAMSTSDVHANLPLDDQRWTVHDFEGVIHPEVLEDPVRAPSISHNRHIHVPDIESWPPSIIFDAAYASCIIKYFSPGEYNGFVNDYWPDRFYPGGVRITRNDGGIAEIERRTAQDLAKIEENNKRRDKRRARRENQDGGAEEMDVWDFLLSLTLRFRRPPTEDERQRWIAEQRELSAAKDMELNQKVTSWLDTQT